MKIAFSNLALENLENLKDYISKDSSSYARIFITKLLSQIENLKAFPFIGHVLPEQDNDSIREIQFYGYRIIYAVEEDRINILTVVHGKKEYIEFE